MTPSNDTLLVPADPAAFLATVKVLGAMCGDLRFKLAEHGLECTVNEPSKAAAARARWGRECFAEFQIKNSTKRFDARAADILQATKATGRGDVVVLKVTPDRLVVQVRGGKVRRERVAALYDHGLNIHEFPEPKTTDEFSFETALLRALLEEAATAAPVTEWSLDDGKFTVRSRGDTTRDEWEADVAVEGHVRLSLTSEFLKHVVGAARVFDRAVVTMSTDRPVFFKFESDGARYDVVIAPRVRDDD